MQFFIVALLCGLCASQMLQPAFISSSDHAKAMIEENLRTYAYSYAPILADTYMTGSWINWGTPLPTTLSMDLGDNVHIVALVESPYLKMVKIQISGPTTFTWLETKYDDQYDSSCAVQSTFVESCFTGVSPGDVYPLDLMAEITGVNDCSYDLVAIGEACDQGDRSCSHSCGCAIVNDGFGNTISHYDHADGYRGTMVVDFSPDMTSHSTAFFAYTDMGGLTSHLSSIEAGRIVAVATNDEPFAYWTGSYMTDANAALALHGLPAPNDGNTPEYRGSYAGFGLAQCGSDCPDWVGADYQGRYSSSVAEFHFSWDGSLNICGAYGECVEDSVGSQCACVDGYSGTPCEDIDECSSNLHECDLNAVCTNTDGSYTCECLPDFIGDGFSCEAENHQGNTVLLANGDGCDQHHRVCDHSCGCATIFDEAGYVQVQYDHASGYRGTMVVDYDADNLNSYNVFFYTYTDMGGLTSHLSSIEAGRIVAVVTNDEPFAYWTGSYMTDANAALALHGLPAPNDGNTPEYRGSYAGFGLAQCGSDCPDWVGADYQGRYSVSPAKFYFDQSPDQNEDLVVGTPVVESYDHYDGWAQFTFALPEYHIDFEGEISTWSVYIGSTGGDGDMGLLLFRPTGVGGTYELVGSDIRNGLESGLHNFDFVATDGSGETEIGDILGLYIGDAKVSFLTTGEHIVEWSPNNGYWPEPPAAGVEVPHPGSGVRHYSVQATFAVDTSTDTTSPVPSEPVSITPNPSSNPVDGCEDASMVMRFSGDSTEDYSKIHGGDYFGGNDVDAFSTCMWIRCQEDDDDDELPLLSWSDEQSDNAFLLMNPHKLTFNIKGKKFPKKKKRVDIADDTWHHVCATYESSNGHGVIYVDGAESSSDEDFETGWVIHHAGHLMVGQEQDCHGDDGCLDINQAYVGYQTDVYVWNVALTADEVFAVYTHSEEAEYTLDMATVTYSDFLCNLNGDVTMLEPTACQFE